MSLQIQFEEDLKKAQKQLELDYDKAQTAPVYALSNFAQDKAFRPQIINFIQTGFDALRDSKKKMPPGQAVLNTITYGAIGRLAGMIGEESLGELIYKEFQFAASEDQDYEVNLEAGTLAIALSFLNYKGETKAFDEFLAYFESSYCGEKFVMEVRYADWTIRKDKLEPVEYLKNPVNAAKKYLEKNGIKVDDAYIAQYGNQYKRNLGLVAAALADLDAKDSLPILKEMLVLIKNSVTKEAFLEAIDRLETQKEAPASKDRMILMFGKINSTELALGEETDNEFVIRAKKKTGDKTLGIVYEVDDSSKDDL